MIDPGSIVSAAGAAGASAAVATVLARRVSDFIGGLAAPTQIRRLADAQADAQLIKVRADLAEERLRALDSILSREQRERANVGNVLGGAIERLHIDARPDRMEEDWIAQFVDRVRLVSDVEMQVLWSSILAREAAAPGAISRRTVEKVSTLEKTEAHLFTALCGYSFQYCGTRELAVFDIPNPTQETGFYAREGLNGQTLAQLDDAGLITFTGGGAFRTERQIQLGKCRQLDYFGQTLNIEILDETTKTINFGVVAFTKSGQELAPLCGAGPVGDFVQNTLARWNSTGKLKVSRAD